MWRFPERITTFICPHSALEILKVWNIRFRWRMNFIWQTFPGNQWYLVMNRPVKSHSRWRACLLPALLSERQLTWLNCWVCTKDWKYEKIDIQYIGIRCYCNGQCMWKEWLRAGWPETVREYMGCQFLERVQQHHAIEWWRDGALGKCLYGGDLGWTQGKHWHG